MSQISNPTGTVFLNSMNVPFFSFFFFFHREEKINYYNWHTENIATSARSADPLTKHMALDTVTNYI